MPSEQPEEIEGDSIYSNIISATLCIAFAFAPLIYNPEIVQISNVPKQAFVSIIFALGLIVIGGAAAISRNDVEIVVWRSKFCFLFSPCVAVFLVYGATSYLWAVNGQLVWTQLYQWCLCAGIFYSIILSDLKAQLIERIFFGLVLGAALGATLGLLQFWLDRIPDHVVVAPAGGFTNKNFSASYSVMALPASIILWFRCRTRGARWFYLVASLMIMLQIFHSFSRASWIACVTSLAVCLIVFVISRPDRTKLLFLLSSSRKIEIAGFVALLFLGTFLGQGELKPRLVDAFQRVQKTLVVDSSGSENSSSEAGKASLPRSETFRSRLEFWENSTHMIADYWPWGVGEGNFQVIFPAYSSIPNETRFNTKEITLRYLHNDPLEMVAELGVVGAGMVVVILLSLGYAFLSLIRRPFSEFSHLQLIGLCAALALSVNSLSNSALNFPLHKCGFAVVLACIWVGTAKKAVSTRLVSWKWTAPFCLIAGVMLFNHAYSDYVLRVRGETAFLKSGEMYYSGNVKEGIALLDQSVRDIPFDQAPSMAKGAVLLSQGRTEDAIDLLEKVSDSFPYDFRMNQNLTVGYMQLGETEKALSAFNRMHKVVPNDPDVNMKRAYLLRESDLDKSNQILMEMLASGAATVTTYIILAENKFIAGKQAEAAKALVDGLRYFPGNKAIVDKLDEFGFEMFSLE